MWPTKWRPDAEVVALVVSELVTNALRHAQGGASLLLVFQAGRLRIVVGDSSLRPPARRNGSQGRIGGHGMDIVTALTCAWGVIGTTTGKRVWADLTEAG